MFGSNDKDQPDNTAQTSDMTAGPVPVAPPPEDSLVSAPPDPVITPTAPPLNDSMMPTPTEPVLPPQPETPTIITNSSKAKDSSSTPPAIPPTEPTDVHDDKLMGIKQQALRNLSPLVGHLDQTPEEKFKTTMMLIQASDNAGLIQDAYEAANAIADEKTRAQALLDVVNEINYFTQHNNPQEG